MDVRHPVRLGPQHAAEGLRAHGPGADFHIVRFLNDAAAVGPVLLEFENDVLEGLHDLQGFEQRDSDEVPLDVLLHAAHQKSAQVRGGFLAP